MWDKREKKCWQENKIINNITEKQETSEQIVKIEVQNNNIEEQEASIEEIVTIVVQN